MQQTFVRLVPLLILWRVGSGPRANVRLPAIISDNMVLQQQTKVRIWGNANPGERVIVTLQQKSSNTVADKQGHWETWLGPLKAGGPFELNVKGDNLLTIRNVLVGEVWLCSGQSNMEWPLINTVDGAETVAQAKYPEIRLFTVMKHTATSPLADVEGHWVVTTPDEAAHFSAVGYFFGRELYQQLKAPVVLIHSWGGAPPAEAWPSHDALLASP